MAACRLASRTDRAVAHILAICLSAVGSGAPCQEETGCQRQGTVVGAVEAARLNAYPTFCRCWRLEHASRFGHDFDFPFQPPKILSQDILTELGCESMHTTPTMCTARMATNRWVAVVGHSKLCFVAQNGSQRDWEPGEYPSPSERSGTIMTLFCSSGRRSPFALKLQSLAIDVSVGCAHCQTTQACQAARYEAASTVSRS